MINMNRFSSLYSSVRLLDVAVVGISFIPIKDQCTIEPKDMLNLKFVYVTGMLSKARAKINGNSNLYFFNAKIQENYNLKSHNSLCINSFDQIKFQSSLWSSGLPPLSWRRLEFKSHARTINI